jgi:hypothetical protein
MATTPTISGQVTVMWPRNLFPHKIDILYFFMQFISWLTEEIENLVDGKPYSFCCYATVLGLW